jgi:hypothetical protein
MKVSNSKELAPFYNAVIYESLESGKSVKLLYISVPYPIVK